MVDSYDLYVEDGAHVIFFWIAVGLLTLAVNFGYRFYSQGKLKTSKPRPAISPVDVSPDELSGLLENGSYTDRGDPTQQCSVASVKMSEICRQHAIKNGLEAAGLAVLSAVLQRRQHGSPSIQVVSGSKVAIVDVELPNGITSFECLLRAADQAFSQAASQQEERSGGEQTVPEVQLFWGAKRSTPEQWSLTCTSDSRILISGSSPDEEKCFEMLFEACASDPQGDVWQLPMYAESVLVKAKSWGAALKDFRQYRNQSDGRLVPIPKLLWKSSASFRYQERAEAVVGDGFSFNYLELQQAATAVASAIQQRMQGNTSKFVVLCMGRGKMLAPSFLGILQAGCTVVPVDVHWPADRAREVSLDCGAQLVLTDTASKQFWEAAAGGEAITQLTVDDELLRCQSIAAGMCDSMDQDDDAVVLFTSGSTGKPKGIVLSHGYLTSLVVGVGETKEMSPHTRTLSYHSPTWMPFLDYLLGPLLNGGCCLFYPEKGTHIVKPNELHDFAREKKATLMGLVPAVLELFLEDGLPPCLDTIGVGGAAVTADLCLRVAAAHRTQKAEGLLLTTGYSGTEQGDVTNIRMRSQEEVEVAAGDHEVMFAGRPHAGQTYAIVDRSMGLVGPGAIGEVMVCGPALATCYLNLPRQTAEYFVKCPALDGARAAHTGDLGKWTKDGQLRLVGRLGSMVKVRGARVDLGEVEVAIAAYPDVKACVVTVHDDRLVAYVEPAVPAGLRDYCKSRLVAYMVPHIFQGLDELPRLANGKVNKKALKPPELQDGAETVMELDSLGQMRKFSRRDAAEDVILDNVRAILLGVVMMSHSIPMSNFLDMRDPRDILSSQESDNLDASSILGSEGARWSPWQFWFLVLLRSGGWSSLAFLSGFDDTRAEHKGYGLTYREVFFVALWVVSGTTKYLWYLPAFVVMRLTYVAFAGLGLEWTYMLSIALLFTVMPAFVDLYIGIKPEWFSLASRQATCTCLCPFESLPWAQRMLWFIFGFFQTEKGGEGHLGHRLIFMPAYFIGLYSGKYLFPVLCGLCNEKNKLWRSLAASLAIAIYLVLYTQEDSVEQGYQDHCTDFWKGGSFLWLQVIENIRYYALNLSMSLLYVIVIVALVPVHLQYLAKISFFSLLVSPYAHQVLNLRAQVLAIRQAIPSLISPWIELAWVVYVPFLYELVSGAILFALIPLLVKGSMKFWRQLASICSRGE